MIERVVVIGAGTMGHGIAQVCAAAGCDVSLTDATQEQADAGVARIRANLEEAVRRRKAEPADVDATLARIVATAELERASREADLIIEAVPERMNLKREVFERAAATAPEHCILASNTSSLSITELQALVPRPHQFIGLHFFNPPHINRLLEIVRGRSTSDAVVERCTEFAVRIGREPVLVNDSPGFATSRLGVLLGLEAIRMVEEGVASAADIDRAMELGYRHPMGPLRLTDLVGLDVRLDIARYLHEKLGAEQFRPPRLLEEMVERGELGKKSGRGFYDWSDA